MKLKLVLQIFGGIAVLLTLLPLVAMDYWWIRMFDFPHIQLTILTFVAFIVYFVKFDIKLYKDYAFVIILAGCLLFQFTKIYPYTAFASYEVLNSTDKNSEKKISIYTANVFQKNKKPEKLIEEIKQKDADIYLFLETNTRWKETITKNLPSAYKYRVEIPLDNTYGMLLYSKLPLIDPQINYLVDDSIPSIHSKLVLRSNDTVNLYTIHPTPPMPQHNPLSTDRDAEMMIIANKSRSSKLPVLVIGDFNDVAWSATTTLFQNVGELLDVRKGRGFYNTFNAKSVLFRWPLDHIFISSEFRVETITLGKDINSDHFPTYTVLTFEPERKMEQQPKKPTENQLKRAIEQAKGVQDMEVAL